MDPFFPFEEAVDVWARTFAALGIQYKGATMRLDLCDRAGKYSNGFCHWPQPAWRKVSPIKSDLAGAVVAHHMPQALLCLGAYQGRGKLGCKHGLHPFTAMLSICNPAIRSSFV